MKNLSQKLKLFIIFICTAFIPILLLGLFNTLYTNKAMNQVAAALLEDRLSHDIVSAQLYLDQSIGLLNKQGNTLVTNSGDDIAEDTDFIETISSQMDEEITIFMKDGSTYIRYLTSIKDKSTGKYMTGTELDSTTDVYTTLESGKTFVGEIDLFDIPYLAVYQPMKNRSGEVIGALFLGLSIQDINQMIHSQTSSVIRMNSIIAIVFSLIGIVLILILAKIITSPLLALKERARKLSEYDFTVSLPDHLLHRKDEIGVVAQAINSTIENMRELIQTVAQKSSHVSNISSELDQTSSESASVASELGKTVSDISYGATSQADNTSDCLKCLERLGDEVQNNTQKMSMLNSSSQRMDSFVQQGQTVLKELVAKIEESNQATAKVYSNIQTTSQNADQISNISSMIAGIADQTNLLALNASIEAARAGEAGRGFSVVAEEIRKLAEQSAESTRQIDEQIRLFQQQASSSVVITGKVKEILADQNISVQKTEQHYDQIAKELNSALHIITELDQSSASMNEQKNTAMEYIQNLSAVAEENAAATEQASACIEEQSASLHEISNNSTTLSELANELNSLIQKFKVQ